ncbi:DUF3846 domain-containing protein [Streptomyces sp. NPDC017964]|uniref:DUF3846 domain-containing protein n=1 Tax=Streptomyces sp. NPDC017964 TaxID=3365022 RepID=UPI0037B5BD2C
MRIDVDTTVTVLDLPEDASEVQAAIRGTVGDAVNTAVYHRRALLHIHDSANRESPLNLAAWTLASAWRGMSLYPLHGTIVVTGCLNEEGDVTGLDEDLVHQAEAVAVTVRETVQRCRERPPMSDEAAAQELLAYAARDLAAHAVGQR